ncbi:MULTISPECIES: universal stress protein [unclassified Luteococcus]|uniref:universal stress protein n=1 Tax=unclassified Luteococcus TaxID=2639923 RepID=UPI00313B3161
MNESVQIQGPRVLVGVDGSEDGLRAVRYGVGAAERRNATLHLVHAVDDAVMAGAWGVVYDPSALQEAGEHANRAAIQVAREAGLPTERIHAEVVLGNAAAVLARLSEGADLLVVGRRSVSGLERMFIGSTSVALADAAHCPVVVISAAATPGLTGGMARIAVGVDAHNHSPQTLEWAMAEAEARGVSLTVVHVAQQNDTGAAFAEVEQAARAGIDGLLAPLRGRHPEVPVEVVIAAGTPVDELVDLSATVDLLVLGVQKAKLLGIHLGGVMRAVLAHAESPVALVK